MRIVSVLAISALTLGTPVLTDDIGFTDAATAFAKGNGNGGGNGGGNGNGGNGRGGGKDKASNGNGGDKSASRSSNRSSKGGKRAGNGGGLGKALDDLFGGKKRKARAERAGGNKTRATAAKPSKKKTVASAGTTKQSKRPPKLPELRAKPVQAQLKGLNSLNRNINGLMNSNDPKMDGFRDFIAASAAYAAALQALEAVQVEYEPIAEAYAATLAALGLEVPETQEGFDALSDELDALASAPAPEEDDYLTVNGTLDEEAFAAALDAWSSDVEAAQQAQAEYDGAYEGWQAYDVAAAEAAGMEEGASEDAMVQAMVDGLNATGARDVTAADITDEMIDWVGARLGVGDDQDGLTDDYIAQQDSVEETDGDLPREALDDGAGDDALPQEEAGLIPEAGDDQS